MIDEAVQTYPKYKKIDIPWLEQVPAHWKILPLCAIAKPKSITNKEHRELLSVYLYLGVIPFSDKEEKRTNPTSKDLSNYQAVEPGDFVLNNQQAWRGSVGVSNYKGIISPAYLVLSLNEKIQSDFANFIFREKTMVAQYLVSSKGVGTIQRNLYWSYLKRIPVFIPPRDEQRAITHYLDWADERIQRLINAREKQIELLEEYKQVIIQQAVTGQIDVRTGEPYPSYKDSGVDWLGKVPKHWDMRRLKFLAKLNPSKNEFASLYDRSPNAKTVFLPMENISENGDIDASDMRTLSSVWNGLAYFCKNDIIVAKITPCFENGKGAYLKNLPFDFGFGTTELFVLRASEDVQAEFLYLITKMQKFRKLGADAMTGAAGQQRVPLDFVKNFWLPLPSKKEQLEITRWIKRKNEKYESTIHTLAQEIKLVHEYHTRLIADVVTGKVDVRQAAANLPDREDQFDDKFLDRVENDLEGEPYANQ